MHVHVCLCFFFNFPLGLCEGVYVYVHDILCMTTLIVTIVVMLVCDYGRFMS